MLVHTCKLEGILLIEPDSFEDQRGFFLETYEESRYGKFGILDKFVQDNHSRSKKNVLRGLHFTKRNSQAQIVTVIRGAVFDVVVDIRKDSPTWGQWFGVELSDQGLRQIYMPHGFAHGFCVLSDYADLHYKVSHFYDASDEGGLIWDDSEVKIDWPIDNPIISDRDLLHSDLRTLWLKQSE